MYQAIKQFYQIHQKWEFDIFIFYFHYLFNIGLLVRENKE